MAPREPLPASPQPAAVMGIWISGAPGAARGNGLGKVSWSSGDCSPLGSSTRCLPTVVSAPALKEELESPKQTQTQDLSWQSEVVLA